MGATVANEAAERGWALRAKGFGFHPKCNEKTLEGFNMDLL